MARRIVWIIDEEWSDYELEKQMLSDLLPEYELRISGYDYGDDLERLGNAVEGILAQIYARIPGDVIERLPRLKVISVYGGGYDRVDLEAAKRKGVVVTYVPGYCVEEVSDHVMASILYFARKLHQYDEQIRKGRWGAMAAPEMPVRLKDSTLFIIGFGRIGRAVAIKARALGMRVLAYDPYVTEHDFIALGVERVYNLHEGLRDTDFVSLHVPLTEETKGMIGEREIEAMKDGAVIINTARGEVIDESSLIRAIKNGKLGGAALDVVSNEPPDPEREVFKLRNVLITPHVAYLSQKALRRLRTRAVENLVTVLKNRPIPPEVLAT